MMVIYGPALFVCLLAVGFHSPPASEVLAMVVDRPLSLVELILNNRPLLVS
jgi:hypothetical protein